MKIRHAIIAAALITPATTMHGQTATAGLPGCKGTSAIMRTSTLTGSPAKFQAAVDAHTKWYRDHGVTTNKQVVVPMYKRVDSTYVVDSTQVITFHTNPPSPGPKHDAGCDGPPALPANLS